MTSDRPYRKALAFEAAFAELQRCSGQQFDPRLVSIFQQAWQNGEIHAPNKEE
jgi:HD-GYP domain